MKKENSTDARNKEVLQNFCNVYKILSEITGRWKVSILFSINKEDKTYSEIKLLLPNITDRMLTKQLKELQEDNIIVNKKDKVTSRYALNKKGKQILDLLNYMQQLEFD